MFLFYISKFALGNNNFFSPKTGTPIKRNKCGANINGYLFDMEEPFSRYNFSEFTYADSKGGNYTYYLKPCGDLPDDAYPESVNHSEGISGIRCPVDDPTNCQIIGFHETQDYDFIDSGAPDSGFIIRYVAPSQQGDSFSLFSFVYVITCNPTGNSSEIPTFSDPPGEIPSDIFTIYMSINHKGGCPTTVTPPPTPPPPPAELNCSYLRTSSLLFPYQIDLNLKDLNLDPRGSPIIYNNTVFALVQPCGVSDCPPDMTCDQPNSSIWICVNDTNCTSYGNAYDYLNIAIRVSTDFDADQGLLITYHPTVTSPNYKSSYEYASSSFRSKHSSYFNNNYFNNNYLNNNYLNNNNINNNHKIYQKLSQNNNNYYDDEQMFVKNEVPIDMLTDDDQHTAKLYLTCDFDVDSKMMRIEKIYFDNDGYAIISASTGAVCIHPTDPPEPECCKAQIDPDHYVSLVAFNQIGGIEQKVNLNISDPSHEYTLYYNPCDGITCPGAECEYPNGASIWLCRENTGLDLRPSCDNYAIYGDNLTMKANYKDSKYNGYNIDYSVNSQNRHQASVKVRCDPSLDPLDMTISKNVDIYSGTEATILTIMAHTKNACANDETWSPPEPSPLPQPPQPQHSGDTFINGDVKYRFSALSFESKVFTLTNKNTAQNDGEKASVIIRYTPFSNNTCPPNEDGMENDCIDANLSQGWACWYDKCYPIADHSLGYDTDDTSADFIVYGYGNFKSLFSVTCDASLSPDTIVYDDNVIFNNGTFNFKLNTSLACPNQPTPFPTQTPQPTQTPIPSPTPEPEPEPSERNAVTGGSIFLTIVILFLVCYFGIGTIVNYAIHGIVDVPNHDFWHQIIESICLAIQTISCNKIHLMADDSYKNI